MEGRRDGVGEGSLLFVQNKKIEKVKGRLLGWMVMLLSSKIMHADSQKINQINAKIKKFKNSPLKIQTSTRVPQHTFSRNLHQRGPYNRHAGQAIDVLCRVLPRQRRERDPGQPLRDRALDHALIINGGGRVADHVGLVHPAHVQRFAQVSLTHSRRVEGEGDRSAAARHFTTIFCDESGDHGERRRGGAGVLDDEKGCEIEGVGGGDAGVEGGRVGDVADGVVAEEDVVAGFDREDRSGSRDYIWVRESETGSEVDDRTDPDRGDVIG